MSTVNAPFALSSAKSGEPLKLAMQRLWLSGQVLPAGAVLVVHHDFRSDEKRPLEVIYSFPLPRDAALRRFRIVGEGFETHSDLRDRDEAAQEYEHALAAGSLAALAHQHGDGIVNLTVGNIRPGEAVTVDLEIVAGVELRDDGLRFRYPFTLAPGYHPRARMSDGEIELPSGEFGDVMLPQFRPDAAGLHQVGFDLRVFGALEIAAIASPSHAVCIRHETSARCRVSLAPEADVPDRDLVLDASFRHTEPQILAGGGQFAAVVPSTVFGSPTDVSRRVVILLDRSGSMAGPPLEQAVRAISACLGAFSGSDLFGLVAFDDRVEPFAQHLMPATGDNREAASAFLRAIDARGGTELGRGVSEAVRMLGSVPGDVLILTDGQVFGTESILEQARGTNTRLHCLGIGSASQDRFLALLSRETGGVSRFMTPRERVDLAAVDLFASIGRPVATGLEAIGAVEPAPPQSVFAGTPVVLFGKGQEALELTWDGGRLTLPLPVGDPEFGETLRLLRGARLITDWDSRYPAAEANSPIEKRKNSRIAARLRDLSREYCLATRETSLVAVVRRQGDRPGELPETRIVPVGMAQDVRWDSYFAAAASRPVRYKGMESMMISGAFMSKLDIVPSAPVPQPAAEDKLLDLAARMETDGGMPGGNPESRVAATILALWAFLSEGHTAKTGAFRTHVARLIAWLENRHQLTETHRKMLEAILDEARRGIAPAGNWIDRAVRPEHAWSEIESAAH